MNIPDHERRNIISTMNLSPMELGTLTRAVDSCLQSGGALKDAEYRAMLLVLRDRLLRVAETFGGLQQKSEMED
jgi:hypothetical protein